MPDLNATVRARLGEIRKNAQRAGIAADEEEAPVLDASAADAERLADALIAIIERYGDQHWHGSAIPHSRFPEMRVDETGACRTCVTLRLIAETLGLDARMPDDEAWEQARARMASKAEVD